MQSPALAAMAVAEILDRRVGFDAHRAAFAVTVQHGGFRCE
jgi:hypothetical protein